MPASAAATALYTTDQVRRIDRRAIEELGIAGYELMQRAAAAAFTELRRRWPLARRIVLLAGRGNNGGDAFLLGVRALEAGFDVVALALGQAGGGDALRARLAFVAARGRVIDAVEDTPLPAADVYVDGLFGTGLARPLEGAAAALVARLAAQAQAVLALDVPSGLAADTGSRLGPAVRADLTVCFIAWKRGLFTADAGDCCGQRRLASLEVPAAAWGGEMPDAELMDGTLGGLLAPRPANSNKGRFGHVLLVGGDAGMGGAVQLAGRAALRCGAGLVSVATRAGNVIALNGAAPELMAHGVDEAAALAPLLARASVLAIGPGLGQGAWGRALLDAALDAALPLVLDADALNLLAATPRSLPGTTLLTPHPGEAARLLGCAVADIQRDRFAAARTLAARFAAVVVLKGAGSLVAAPDGRVAVCPWGNPGMASAGMGDVLTGVIAALLAQHLPPWDAARLGVALHARAGDLAAAGLPRGLVASDLADALRQLVNRFES
ncbi:NAD(P)H-hydrate dehydratase [Dokdonella sp.]|uniref:NAD(P)H-hydrate dehydratase n=1 Tax=Dokdonella sp. TaxID=2291710 RepID=UPI0031C9ECD0|nr:NAD(P)H-hydrate dehydratase [Dokdonella sp.]